jgi:hypothetical protein
VRALMVARRSAIKPAPGPPRMRPRH